MLLGATSVRLDHVGVLLCVTSTIIRLLSHLRRRLTVPVRRGLLCARHTLAILNVGLGAD